MSCNDETKAVQAQERDQVRYDAPMQYDPTAKAPGLGLGGIGGGFAGSDAQRLLDARKVIAYQEGLINELTRRNTNQANTIQQFLAARYAFETALQSLERL